MTAILVKPAELKQTAQQLRASAKKISAAMQNIDKVMASLKGTKFLGNRADLLQSHYAPKREALQRAKDIVAAFAADLDQAATSFEQADKGSSPSTPAKPAPVNPPVKPVAPPPTADPGLVKKVKDAIAALDVTQTPRYQPRNGNTYCNIFAMDFCKKMGVPFPEWLDWNKDGKIDDYLNANEAISWLNGSYNKGGVQTGAQLGWKTVSAEEAAKYASGGKVVLAGWTNPVASQPGHLAVVRPESTAGNIQIAQAGGKNFDKGPVTQGFGNRPVTYFVYAP